MPEPGWPLWVDKLFKGAASQEQIERDGVIARVFETSAFRFVRSRMRGARELAPREFEAATVALYAAIARQMARPPTRHAVRVWNYIPDIHRLSGPGIDRYMVFNAGRFEACRTWLGDFSPQSRFEGHLPTASGIGHGGNDLVIDALLCEESGAAVENPRQIPSYKYARRYGPKPPCFSRATMLPATAETGRRILVGGTASIVGEDSLHAESLAKQIQETLLNLASLVRAAGGIENVAPGQPLLGLELFEELRIYHPCQGDIDAIGRAIAASFSPDVRVQWVPAQLCRRELLVEIEGVARCGVSGI